MCMRYGRNASLISNTRAKATLSTPLVSRESPPKNISKVIIEDELCTSIIPQRGGGGGGYFPVYPERVSRKLSFSFLFFFFYFLSLSFSFVKLQDNRLLGDSKNVVEK